MIIVGGENLVDLIEKGEKDSDPIFQAQLGGSPYNCALAIGRQGVEVAYLTPISNDNFGDLLADNLTASNVTLLAKRSNRPTSLALATLDKGNAKYQFYRENTADRIINLATLNKITPKEAKAFFVGSLALTQQKDGNVWAKYLIQMQQKGLFIALDPNIRADFIKDKKSYLIRVNKILDNCDLLKLSDEDLHYLVPKMTLINAAKSLLATSSTRLIIVTMGKDGAFAVNRLGQLVNVKAVKTTKFKDSIGAGDTFTASILAYLCKNNLLSAKSLSEMSAKNIENMLKHASKAATLNCEKLGCNPPFSKDIK